ncbi:LysR substrate-binding domain-containing protein [Cupriavidus sp. AcVe19-6a]|uniref:LysR substrate-binding domain-containing protein n=1 Tax=Cupriavidus sp. AcVe19-6a TaxID=2821358 RepID=UPI001AE22382|nr:LysR substrate-binding domain-containing protein [Cupriavidus sp. AcVe19-6a]MBP0640260.1 hypothetical protein [Cupriavidus sp. AcVe19-6a]
MLSVELDVVSSEAANQRLLSGEASIAMVFSLSPQPDVQVQFTQNAPVMALMSNEHPLADRSTVELADLAHYPILLQDKGATNRQLFDIACNVDGVEITPAITSRYVGALYGFVKTLPGAIMPSGYLAIAGLLRRDELVAVRFSNPLLTQRRLQIRTLAGRQLDDLVRECIEHISEDLRKVSIHEKRISNFEP